MLANNVASGADTSDTILDRQWESLMLEGKSFALVNGEQLRSGGTPYQRYEGKVGNASFSDRGIRLEDLRETSFAGLLTKGGWRLEGGLLYAAPRKNGGIVELYGKSRWRVEPQLFHFSLTFHSGMSPPRSARHSYEFFLLYRPAEGAVANILTQWTVPPEDVPYDHYLRGQLNYDPGTDIATVTATDMEDKKTVLTERVGVAKLIMDTEN
ncbi:MAG: hypothetical protein A4E20_00665 [Nitrospira sp. SG-bin2]|jgi:hypothetical protein|nr:MAG: hypothetical protein A4E20_00665 [Nitrospira sp. SG-bin2]